MFDFDIMDYVYFAIVLFVLSWILVCDVFLICLGWNSFCSGDLVGVVVASFFEVGILGATCVVWEELKEAWGCL